MLKKNKSKIILSAIFILLPMLFGIIMWNKLPSTMTTHWGADGHADGFGGKTFAVFGIPCIMLIFHSVCLLVTLLDKKQKEQSQKALGMIFWIVPIISLLTSGIMYSAALGKEMNATSFVPILLGIMFIFMGNYLPKIKQNSTLGIKVSWALHNEENWNKTHRLGGKIWVAGGVSLFVAAFLPTEAMMWIMLLVIAAISVIPCAYSYYIYKQHQKEGVVYATPSRSKTEEITVKISAVIVTMLLIGVAVLMFTGNIAVDCGDTSFQIKASYWTDIEVDYEEIDTIEYRKDLRVGARSNGFGSTRLSMGIFENEEFDSYTLYAYTNAEEFVVMTSGQKTLVIGMRDAQDTEAIYEEILSKMN